MAPATIVVACGILLGSAACVPTPQRVAPRARSPLVEAVLPRDRDAAAKQEAVRSELAALRQRLEARSSRQPPIPRAERARFREEQQLLEEIERQFTGVRWTLAQMLETDSTLSASRQSQQPDSVRRRMDELNVQGRVLSYARNYEFGLRTYDNYWSRSTRLAGLQVEAAKQAGAPAETVSQLQQRFALHERVVAARRELRVTWDFFLAAMQYQSIEDIQQRRQRHHAAQDAERRARDREAGETFSRLVVTFGIVAAVAAILSSEHSTSSDRDTAMNQLEQAKRQGQEACLIRGGRWLDGGPTAVGTCAAAP